MRRFSKGPNTLFEWRVGQSIGDAGGVFTRADATKCATYIDYAGTVRTIAANTPRDDHWFNGERYLLLEPTSANQLKHSQELDDAAWTLQASTIGANVAIAPDGSLSADKIIETATTNSHNVSQSAVNAPSDNSLAVMSGFVQISDTRQWCQVVIRRKDNTFARVWFNLSTGQQGTLNANGFAAGIVQLGATTWYRVWLVANVLSGGTAAAGYITVSTGDTVDSYAGDITKGLYAWGLMFENTNQPFPTSYIATTSAVVTRAADNLYVPWANTPAAMTVWCKHVDLGASVQAGGSVGVWALTSAASGQARFMLYASSANHYGTQYINAASASSQATGNAIAYGDKVETRSLLATSGATVTQGQSINGSAENVTTGGTVTVDGSWVAGVRLYIGSRGTNPACLGLQALRILPGAQTMAAMEYDFYAAIGTDSAEFAHIIEAQYSTGTVRLCTAAQNLAWNGQTWSAVGGLLEIGGIEETADGKGQGVDIKISAVDQTVLSVLLTAKYRGRPIKIWRAQLDRVVGQIVGDPVLLCQGLQLSPYTIEESRDRKGGTVNITTRVSGYFSVSRVRGIMANVMSHQQLYAGDTFWQNTPALTNTQIYWGTTNPQSPGRATAGSGPPEGGDSGKN